MVKTNINIVLVMLLSGAALFTSCHEDFDWDDAHANTAQKMFSDTFFKEFGKPANDHQWGFDYQWAYKNQQSTRAVETKGNIVLVKPDSDDAAFKYIGIYGQVPDINEREHREVFDWFSTHHVDWGDKTTRIIADLNDTSHTYKLYKNNAVVTIPSNGWTNNIDKVEICDTNGNVEKTYTGEFYLSMDNNAAKGKVVKRVYFNVNSPAQTRYSGDNTTITATYDETNRPLYSGNSIKPVGETSVGLKINFTHAWMQKVADDNDFDSNNDLRNYQNDEKNVFGQAQNAGVANMNYLEIFDLKGNHHDLNDFNAGTGYGYGTGDQIKTNNNYPGLEVTQNGEMILGSNLNNLSIHNSNDGLYHDKWIIVYLEGGYEKDPVYKDKDGNPLDTRYAGYYIGFDYEAAKNDAADYQIGANGYCNDWIFKLTAVDPYKENVIDSRIMCEDLGGLGNSVTIKGKVHISDIDYNDIVLDVTRRTPSGNIIDLTLRAAGGTLPLTVWYENKPLFETHEFFQKGAILTDQNHTYNVDYSIMYNTDKNKSLDNTETGKQQPTFSLYFNGSTAGSSETNKHINTGENIDKFDVGKLLIKVWRLDVEQYTTNPNSYSDAEWVNITNINGQAPLKLCVPQTVDWLIERQAISTAYPKFRDWVGDPTQHFWTNTTDVVPSYLYNNN